MDQATRKDRELGDDLELLLREQPYARAEAGVRGAADQLVSVTGDAEDAHGSRDADADVRRDAGRREVQAVARGRVYSELEVVEGIAGRGIGHGTRRPGDQDVSAKADGERSGRIGHLPLERREVRADVAKSNRWGVGNTHRRAEVLGSRQPERQPQSRKDRRLIRGRDLTLAPGRAVDRGNADHLEPQAELTVAIR